MITSFPFIDFFSFSINHPYLRFDRIFIINDNKRNEIEKKRNKRSNEFDRML